MAFAIRNSDLLHFPTPASKAPRGARPGGRRCVAHAASHFCPVLPVPLRGVLSIFAVSSLSLCFLHPLLSLAPSVVRDAGGRSLDF